MPQLKAVTLQAFKDKYWKRYESYKFAEKDNLAPLVAAELNKAIQVFPMAFIKQADNFMLVGVMSLLPDQNMFVGPNGQWLGAYTPSAFRGYPFRLSRAEGRDDMILCLDEDSGLISEAEGEPFFDEDGSLSQEVKAVMDFLSQVEQSRIVTDLAVSALADAGLITEWPLKANIDGIEKSVTGLYMVDEAKLNNLDDQDFLKLRKTGSLPIAYAQLLSMNNISSFDRLRKIHEQIKKQSEPSLDAGLYFGDDDTFKF